MSSPPVSISPIRAALDDFPEDRPLVLRLAVCDETFRAICEDYTLATGRLAELRSGAAGADPDELADYVALVAELGAELQGFVRTAQRTPEG